MILVPIGAGSAPAKASTSSSSSKTSSTPSTSSSGTPTFPTLLQQPLFDPRIRTLTWPMQGGVTTGQGGDFGSKELLRGALVWDQAAPYESQPEVNFLFNPTTVTASYDMDATDVAASLMFRSPGDTAQAAYATNQSVSISLYFDRTFELWGSYNPATGLPYATPMTPLDKGATSPNPATGKNTTTPSYNVMDPSVFGVNVDILAFKQLTGQLMSSYTAGGAYNSGTGTNPSLSGYSPGLSQQGVFTMVPTWLYLGPNTGLIYYGYVSDFTVTVTHLTQWMVPIRCVIDLDFALMMPPQNEPNGPSWTDWMLLDEIAQDNGGSALTPASTSGKAGR